MDTTTHAKITVQSLVRRFPLIAGMTGTAASAAAEFKKIYHMPVAIIPPNRPYRRTVLPTLVLPDEQSKWNAIVEEVLQIHGDGRPVLIGTRSIAKSERLSSELRNAGIVHQVLNARQIEREAEIVADAGTKQYVTVATNMAGRGTDIRIDSEVAEVGGLHVIGSEMHQSSRIDRQLFGRCGRQGDPGSVRQFISMEDDLLDQAFGRRAATRYRKIGKSRTNRFWIHLFAKAQSKVEHQHYRARRILMYNEKMLARSQREMGLDPILDNYD
jgi:preprotein translocase subunit SecA